MRSFGKLFLLLLIMALSWIIFSALIHSPQSPSFSEKSCRLLTGEMNFPIQEITKYRYVGMEKCASVCHNNEKMGFQYDIMINSAHSNAFKILVSDKAARYAAKAGVKESPQDSPECVKCHVTGGGLDSSFFAPTYRKEEGVTCEACHKAAFITKAFIPKEEVCIRCHNDSVHRVGHFNFRKDCEKISHPRPASRQKEK
jgi:Cytochrome c554 and c-prime